MKAVLAGALTALFFSGCAGHPVRAPVVDTIPIRPAAPSNAGARLRVFRNYFTLERVGIPAHHFTVWYRKMESARCRVAVFDADTAKAEGCGLGEKPASLAAVPSQVEALARTAERAVRGEEPEAKDVAVRYDGFFRELVVGETIPMENTPNGPVGWYGKLRVRTEPRLEVRDGETAFGVVNIPATAARIDIDLPPNENGKSLLTQRLLAGDTKATLARTYLDRALSLAGDVVSGKPVRTMGPVLAGGLDPSLPEGYESPVHVKCSILAWMRKSMPNPRLELDIPLRWRDALEPGGQTRATTEGDIAGLHVRASATLGTMVPASPLPYTEDPWRSVEMSLTVRIEDHRGHVFERRYPARGNILVEGRAAATIGFVVPDYGSSNHDRESLKVTWPGNTQAGAFDLELAPEVALDPRLPH